MHFRIRKNIVQLVRTTYDPQTKKPATSVVGKMPLANPQIGIELTKALTDAELAETKAWIQGRSKVLALRQELATVSLPENLQLATDWFELYGRSEDAKRLAHEIFSAWMDLRRQLKKQSLID